MLRSNRLLRGKWLLRHHYGLRHHRAVAIEAVGERIAILDCFLNDAVFCAAAHVVHYKRDKHDEEDSAKDDGCDRGDEDFLMVGILRLSRNLVGISINFSKSEEEELFINNASQRSSECLNLCIERFCSCV